METISVKVEKSGRILIPAAVRRRFDLKEGTEVILRVDEDGIQMGTREQALARIRKELRRYIPEGSCLSEELIQERRSSLRMRASACSRVPIWMPSSSTRRITSVPSFRSNRRRTAAGIKILPDFSTLTEIVSIRQFYHNMNGPGLLTPQARQLLK